MTYNINNNSNITVSASKYPAGQDGMFVIICRVSCSAAALKTKGGTPFSRRCRRTRPVRMLYYTYIWFLDRVGLVMICNPFCTHKDQLAPITKTT